MIKTEQYTRFELRTDLPLTLTSPSGKPTDLEPFEYQPIAFDYDAEGAESVRPDGGAYKIVRFFPDEIGVYTYPGGSFECVPGGHGYVVVSGSDPRYFAYTDGTSYCPIGINLAFISPFGKSDGREFGRSGFRFLGMREYERWFRACHENGVDLARVWLGHEYFCPDTGEAGVLDGVQLSKIEALVDLARRYDIKLKLTLEQFRYFDYQRVADSDSYSDDVFRKFNKRLFSGGKRCENPAEWLHGEEWRGKWLIKVKELAKRFSGDPTIFGVELWNEMSCMPYDDMLEWNRHMLPEVKKLFPRQLVMNSLGSFDSEGAARAYESFCWELSDIKQLHRYLDQGAPYEVCHDSPIKLIRDGVSLLAEPEKPLLVAETGAVNDRHSGPFRYYLSDHNGLLFCDLVYTPLFCGAAGCGHIWHWDGRYVEAKNLYRLYKPLCELICGVDFDREGFVSEYIEDDETILMLLRGKNVTLGYLRNKSYSWQNVLRDMKDIEPVKEKKTGLSGNIRLIRIWESETAVLDGGVVRDLSRGVFIKAK